MYFEVVKIFLSKMISLIEFIQSFTELITINSILNSAIFNCRKVNLWFYHFERKD